MSQLLLFLFIAGFFTWLGHKIAVLQEANRASAAKEATENYLRQTNEPYYVFSASPTDGRVLARYNHARKFLDSIGKESIPVCRIVYGGVDIDGKATQGDPFSWFLIRLGREVQAIQNREMEKVHAMKNGGANRAETIFAGQHDRVSGQTEWTHINGNRK